MARSYRSRAGRRTRNRIYTVLVVLIIVVVVASYYEFFGGNETEPESLDNNISPGTSSDFVVHEINEATEFLLSVETEPMPVTDTPEPVPTESEPVPAEQQPQTEQPSPQPEISEGLTVEPNPEADKLITEAQALLNERPARIIEARDKLNLALRIPMSVEQRAGVKEQLSELADDWLFSRTVYADDPLCETYQVKPGDILDSIGKKYKVPYEIIMQINSISNPLTLPAGRNIKVINGPFHAKIYRSIFTMDIYLQNTFVRSFTVGLGLPDKETPTGLWRVAADGKMEQPVWYDEVENRTYFPEDPDYPLGSRWIGLEGLEGEAKGREGFAIHGTKDPEQIGTQGSRGCIRMHNGEVIFVYNLLFPIDSLVEVTD